MVSVHILLRFGLIDFIHLCDHVLETRLLHQFIEKGWHLIVILANFLCFMDYFFTLFGKSPFQQLLRTNKFIIKVFVIVAETFFQSIIEETCGAITAASPG
jgi:hypothetical protein